MCWISPDEDGSGNKGYGDCPIATITFRLVLFFKNNIILGLASDNFQIGGLIAKCRVSVSFSLGDMKERSSPRIPSLPKQRS